ncbi:MAG: amidase family protein [Bacilli bacterium]|nr:amidase family protein [Bacilli bacterium]
MEFLNKTIEEINKDIKDKKVTYEELLIESIERSKYYQEQYNSFVTITEDYAFEQLKNIDNIEDNMLKGIPCAIKDNFSTKGVLSTGSSNILKDYVPFFDATVVEKIKLKGSLMIGKTVLDELGMGGSGTTGHTGAVKNPWDNNKLIGGSSAGSAASVALGIVPFALGSDTGDSVRKPASYGGIVGYKPTYGLISRFGLFAFASSLDHVGIFTRSVKDVAIVLDATKGYDPKDMTSLEDNNEFYKNIDGNIKGKKLFYFKEMLDINNYKDETDSELEEIFENFKEVIENAKKIGFEVTEVSFDKDILKAVFPIYFTISCAEATSNNSNLTGIIYGPRGEGTSIEDIMFDARTKGFSELVKRRFVIGNYILQKENQEKLFLNASRIRRLIVDKMNSLFKEYDALILPASGSTAPSFKSDNIDKISNRHLLLENHMAIANFGGFPSITIPCGFVNKMPIGLSITSGIKSDLKLLNIAYAIEGTMNYKGQLARRDK